MLPNRLLTSIVVSSLLAGCAVGPDYVKPEMPLPGQYMGQAAVARRSAANAEIVSWWQGFGDQTLTRLVTLALEQNFDLAQATAQVTQACAGLGAANAALLPSGNVSGRAARAHQPGVD